jgi:UDP-galactopyranose mutase
MLMQKASQHLEAEKCYLLGRFAEWEYYNMDVAIGAALDLAARVWHV